MQQNKHGWFTNLFDDDSYNTHLSAVRQYNLSFMKLFNWISIAFMGFLFLSTFLSDYALALKEVYVIFIVLLLAEEIVLNCFPPKGEWWIMPICYLCMAQIYVFCILSGVVFNRGSVAINYFVFLILLPLAVILRFKSMFIIQTLSVVSFSITAYFFNPPELALEETICAVVYYIIGLIITNRLNDMRVNYLGLYERHDESERENAILLNTTPVGIMKLVFTGSAVDVQYINDPAIEMFGYSKAEFLGKEDWDFSEVVHPDDRCLIAKSLANPVVGNGYTYNFRLKHQATDTYRWVACKFLITDISEGSITTLTDFLDIEQQKQAEDASRAKSAFLSRMSHEIRTPINAIMGMAELGREDVAGGETDTDVLLNYFNETTAASKYLLTLVNDVLDTSRIENNKLELQTSVIKSDEFLQNIKTMINPLADQKGVTLKLERLTKSTHRFIGDPVRTKQILVNLLNNAVKFTPSGGTVRFLAESQEAGEGKILLRFEVQDTGIGMTEEFQKTLFSPFTQENTDTTSPFEGTGLGLSIAKSLAQQMGGDITCQSQKGVGTTFVATILADAVIDQAPAIEKQIDEAKDITDFAGMHILLCEDHPLNQKIAKALMERRNCKVDVANNGAEGVKMFADTSEGFYSMVFMDIRMPEMDGLQATTAIRQLDRNDAKQVPIVAMSANAYEEDVQKSLAAGMNAHLAKPVEPQKLYKTIAFFTDVPVITKPVEKKTILLVDDIEMTLAMMTKIFGEEYHVLSAFDGQEAFDILEDNDEIELVITDIMMPVMDGFTLIEKMRNSHRYDHVAIIANTQYGDPGQEEKLLAMGADDFIYKPITPKIAATRVRYVLTRYQHYYLYRNESKNA